MSALNVDITSEEDMSVNIAEIREALAAATPGEWACDSDDIMGVTFFYVGPRNEPESPLWMSGRIICDLEGHERESDAHFIANAPAWLSQLCDSVEAQDKRIAELEAKLSEAKKDSERLENLLNLTGLEDLDGKWAVILEWNNYQDFVQLRQLDGTVLIEVVSEADDFPASMDGEEIPNAMFRKAIDNVKGVVMTSDKLKRG